MRRIQQKKIKLAVAARQTKWAPIWAVLRRFGAGKRIHPSQMTARRRHWRRTKLKLKPRRAHRRHLG
jgi:ribosomal protein L39E